MMPHDVENLGTGSGHWTASGRAAEEVAIEAFVRGIASHEQRSDRRRLRAVGRGFEIFGFQL
ncbi:MAG TPA: hypothetical protein VN695_15690 [Streptosporangiaceae bacterium]|nr:hypothetical protein [Streptosporangiaceae bacterium]